MVLANFTYLSGSGRPYNFVTTCTIYINAS